MRSPSLGQVIFEASDLLQKINTGQSMEKVLAMHLRKEDSLAGAIKSVLYTALRFKGLTDFLIEKLVKKKTNPKVWAILSISLALLAEKKEKAFTVVNQAVNAVKKSNSISQSAPFLNAVLRNYLRSESSLVKEANAWESVKYNAPQWWIDSYKKEFGETRVERIFSVLNKHPPLILRVNTKKISQTQALTWLTERGVAAVSVGKSGLILKKPVPVKEIPGFERGYFSVQDAGAQLAAEILAAKPNMKVLDACAAPGGKTAHILECSEVDLLALEISRERAKKISENLLRLGLTADVKVQDASKVSQWWDGEKFDRILLDAPCTASGIARRHPDIPWIRKSADITKLAHQQKELLENLWPTLAKGGIMLYAVCSIFSEEGEQQIKNFLKTHEDAVLRPFVGAPEGMLRLEPFERVDKESCSVEVHDGFFYALIEKRI